MSKNSMINKDKIQ